MFSPEPSQAPFWRDIYLGTLCRSVLTICPFAPQAGFENPSISLHVIGLNGPTHDLEMAPPDDPRMRLVTGREAQSLWGLCRCRYTHSSLRCPVKETSVCLCWARPRSVSMWLSLPLAEICKVHTPHCFPAADRMPPAPSTTHASPGPFAPSTAQPQLSAALQGSTAPGSD